MGEPGFDLLTDTAITLDGAPHAVRFENGMTGIGSRRFWIDGRDYPRGAVRQSADLTKGNHALYLIRWRDTPWDLVYIFIHENEIPFLLSEANAWRKPRRIEVRPRLASADRLAAEQTALAGHAEAAGNAEGVATYEAGRDR